jgi:hypothetical protein
MSKLTLAEVREAFSRCDFDSCERDNQGQLLYYTGIYEWSNGSFHYEPEDDNIHKPE